MTGVERGWTSENPVTGERGIVLEAPQDNPARRLVAELHVSPGGAVAGEHLHTAIVERFEVIEGRLGVSLDAPEDVREGRPLTARFGDGEGPPR